MFVYRDSLSDPYPGDSKGSPRGFESVATAYRTALGDDTRHQPHSSSEYGFNFSNENGFSQLGI